MTYVLYIFAEEESLHIIRMSQLDQDQEQFSKDVMKMLMNGTANDVTIVLKDGEMKANKDLLKVRCPYFETMFNNNNFVESQTNTVKMMNVEKQTMERVLKYLFSGKMNKLYPPPPNLLSKVKVLDLLRLLVLDQAYDKVQNIVLHSLEARSQKLCKRENTLNSFERGTTFNIIPCLVLAGELNVESVYHKCLQIMSLHIDLLLNCVSEVKPFKKMSFEIIRDFLESGEGVLPDKMKAFKVWFDYNERNFNEEEKMDILKFQLDYVINALDG